MVLLSGDPECCRTDPSGADAVRLTTGWGTDSWIVLCVWGNKMRDKKKEKVEDIEEMRERVKEFK